MLNVLKFPDQKLRQKSKPIKEVTDSMVELAKEMFTTMYAEDGLGLAAPQVGESIRLVVVDVPRKEKKSGGGVFLASSDEDDEDDTIIKIPDPVALINPEVIEGAGTTQYEEGCLSCPDLLVWVDRYAKVKVSYLDLHGRPCELTAEGLKAVCIQHEIDHLNGVLLVDKLSRLKRDFYKNKRLRVIKDEKDLMNVL